MKGVSEIIAIILILMIVIALAALAYTWFSGIFSTMTGTASSAVTTTTNAMNTQFDIEAARFTAGGIASCCTNVTIRNIGTTNINGSMAQAYINGVYASYAPGGGICNSAGTSCGAALSIPPYGTAVIYNVSNASAGIGNACGNTIMVTIGSGLTSSRAISC